jgi:hypothetical protein
MLCARILLLHLRSDLDGVEVLLPPPPFFLEPLLLMLFLRRFIVLFVSLCS